MKPARFTREAWLDFGLQQLATQGPEALKLTRLCATAHKTIGSFYHHFKDQQAYFDAMLAHWKKRNTTDLIAKLQAVEGADSKAQQLELVAMAMSQVEEVGVRSFAQQNPAAAKVVAEVDQMRIAYLKTIYEARLNLPPEKAHLLAKLEYAAFVGTQSIWPQGTLEHGQSLSILFQELVAAKYAGP